MSDLIVCPDCGQIYDPAKGASAPRVLRANGRVMKVARAQAQDVRKASHKNSIHHTMMVRATEIALDGWVPFEIYNRIQDWDQGRLRILEKIANVANLGTGTLKRLQPGEHTYLTAWALDLEAAKSVVIELLLASRRFLERLIKATELTIHETRCWWTAWLSANDCSNVGMPVLRDHCWLPRELERRLHAEGDSGQLAIGGAW